MKKITLLLLTMLTLSCSDNVLDINDETISSTKLKTPKSELLPGEILQLGEYLVSPNGEYRLVMQTDGNLVIYNKDNVATWATNMATYGKASYAQMQVNGDFVVNGKNGSQLWRTDTYVSYNAKITMQDDGNLVIYRSGGAVWSSIGGTRNYFHKTQTINSGMQIYSQNHKYILNFNSRGFTISELPNMNIIWSNNLQNASFAKIEKNGILTIYNTSHSALFRTKTEGFPVGKLAMLNSGNMALQKTNHGENSYLWKNGMSFY